MPSYRKIQSLTLPQNVQTDVSIIFIIISTLVLFIFCLIEKKHYPALMYLSRKFKYTSTFVYVTEMFKYNLGMFRGLRDANEIVSCLYVLGSQVQVQQYLCVHWYFKS